MTISRRTVMKKFGEYLDWITWFNEIKAGLAEPPEGEDASYVIRIAIAKEEDYRHSVDEFIGHILSGESPKGGDA